MSTVQLWSDWECAGGEAIGMLTVVSGSWGVQIDGSDACTLTVIEDARTVVALRHVVRITTGAGTVYEYRVQFRGRKLADATRVLRGLSVLADLGAKGHIRTAAGASVAYSSGGTKTPTEFLNTQILTNLADDSLDWWTLGTVDITNAAYIEPNASPTQRLAFLRTMERTFGGEVRYRRNGSTGYYLDFVESIGASAGTIQIVQGKNLIDLQEDADDGELATAISIRGGYQPLADTAAPGYFASIGENAWTLGTIPGAPYWIPLTDPDGASAAPIVLDDQVNGYYLLTKTGTLVEITDSRASDSAVLVAATTGLAAGDLVQIVKDSSATRLIELTDQNAARLHREDPFSGISGKRNLLLNGFFKRGASDYAIADWTNSIDAGRYPRDSAITYSLTGGTGGVGSTTLTITAGPADFILYKDEMLSIAGVPRRVAATTQLNGSGAGSVTLTSSVSAANGTTITENTDALYKNPRTNDFPEDYTDSDSRLVYCPPRAAGFAYPHTTGAHYAYAGLHSNTYTVKYVAGGIGAYVCAASGWTVRNDSTTVEFGNRDGGSAITDNESDIATQYLPMMRIDKPSTSAILAQTICTQRVPVSSTVDYAITCAAALSSDTDVRVTLYPHNIYSAGQTTSYLRYVQLWLSGRADTVISPLLDDSPSANVLWHRCNRGLLARRLAVRQVKVSIVDLSALAGYSITRESVVLGGEVELVDLGLTARVMGITYDITNPQNTQVVIDSRPKRLIQFLAENV